MNRFLAFFLFISTHVAFSQCPDIIVGEPTAVAFSESTYSLEVEFDGAYIEWPSFEVFPIANGYVLCQDETELESLIEWSVEGGVVTAQTINTVTVLWSSAGLGTVTLEYAGQVCDYEGILNYGNPLLFCAWDSFSQPTSSLDVVIVPQVLGCSDETACNFNPTANTGDGSCDYPGDFCDNLGGVYDENCLCQGTSAIIGSSIKESQITISPNPSASLLNIQGLHQDLSWIGEFYDSTGKCLLTISRTGPSRINIDDLPRGVYILKIATESSETTLLKSVQLILE